MAFRNSLLMPGDRVTIDGAVKVVARLEEHEPTPGDLESSITVHFTDGSHREWGGFEPFWQKREDAGTYSEGDPPLRLSS